MQKQIKSFKILPDERKMFVPGQLRQFERSSD